jgi:hypothetical protein
MGPPTGMPHTHPGCSWGHWAMGAATGSCTRSTDMHTEEGEPTSCNLCIRTA